MSIYSQDQSLLELEYFPKNKSTCPKIRNIRGVPVLIVSNKRAYPVNVFKKKILPTSWTIFLSVYVFLYAFLYPARLLKPIRLLDT